jgi:hypothetical protein
VDDRTFGRKAGAPVRAFRRCERAARRCHTEEDIAMKALVTLITALVTLAVASPALAAPSATLEGEQFAHLTVADVSSTCQYDLIRWNAYVTYTATGVAQGLYAGTFVESGTARLSMFGGASARRRTCGSGCTAGADVLRLPQLTLGGTRPGFGRAAPRL